MSEEANRKYAESLLNGGRDPGGAYADLQQRYQKQQQELLGSPASRNLQSQTYAGNTVQTDRDRGRRDNTPPSQVKRPGSSGVSIKSLFGIGGFIGGLVLGVRLFDENGIAIIIVAGLCAWIASVTYKLLIGITLVILVLTAIFNSGGKTSTKTAFEVSSQATQKG